MNKIQTNHQSTNLATADHNGAYGALASVDHHAAALAQVSSIIAENQRLKEENAELTTRLNRADDRMVMLADERNRFRKEANLFRTHVVELARDLDNVHQIARAGSETILLVKKLLEDVTGGDDVSDASKPQTDDQIALLEKALNP